MRDHLANLSASARPETGPNAISENFTECVRVARRSINMKTRKLPAATLLASMILISSSHYALASELEPIVVTATRTAQTVDESLSSVTIIDREEIERLQPMQFTDLLRGRAGVDSSDNGSFGKTTSIYLRGSNSGHALLLVDGVRMGSATLGSAAWQFLPVSEIERIEIVRGPRTSVYGSDAVGGVIQVFTRKGQAGPPRFKAYSRIGSFKTREVGAGLSGGNAQTRYALSASHYQTDGINVLDRIGDDDRDGYRNTALSGQISHQFDNGLEVFGNLLRAQGRTNYDGFVNRSDFVQQALQGGLRGHLSDRWHSQITLSQSRDESDNYGDNDFFSRFDTRRDMADWRHDIELGERTRLTAGIDWQRDHVSSRNPKLDRDRRDNTGVYTMLQTGLAGHDLTGSLRHDDNQQFGGHTTGQLAWGHDLTDTLRGRASWGTAFKAPSFNDLYWPYQSFGAWGSYQGNPNLKPEKSRSAELGLRYQVGGLYLDMAAFETRINNLIATAGAPDSRPENINKARIRGLELEAGLTLDNWLLRAAVTALEPENRKTGNSLPRRAKQTARLDIDRQLGAFSLGTTVTARSYSYNDIANNEWISGYALMDLRASYQVNRQWQLAASINNLFDRDYETTRAWGGIPYNQPGRAYYLTLRYQP